MKIIKKVTAVLCTFALVIPAYVQDIAVSAAGQTLPFTLEAPKNVAVRWIEGQDSDTTLQLAFSTNDSMIAYMSLGAEEKTARLKECGYDVDNGEETWIVAQYDWAIDDPTAWHYNAYWDGSKDHQLGEDSDYHPRGGEWDGIDMGLNPKTSQEAWILRGVSGIQHSSKDDPDYCVSWYGDDYNPGLKNQLKDGQYEIKTRDDGEQYLSIDYTKHTADEPKISSANSGSSFGQVKTFVTGLKNDNDPKGTTFSFLFGRQKKATKNAITITWQKPKNASYYVIYGNKCGKKNKVTLNKKNKTFKLKAKAILASAKQGIFFDS